MAGELIIQDQLPKEFARLLVIQEPSFKQKLVVYMLGQADIFVEDVTPLATNMAKVAVRYWTEQALDNFITAASGLRVYRIIAACSYPTMSGEPHVWTETNSQFLEEAAKTMFYLLPRGTVVRVVSENKPLRRAFYEAAERVRKRNGFEVGFDFDEYDVQVVLRQIKIPPGVHGKHAHYLVLVHFDRNKPIMDMAEACAAYREDSEAWERLSAEALETFEAEFG